MTGNLLTKKGLCNGAMGTVESIIYKEDQYPLALPIAVLINFDGQKGPCFENTIAVPILPVISTWFTADNTKREQLPLKLTWGITI